MTTQPLIPDWLAQDIARRDTERHNAAATFYATLTDRERALVRDAAVMGYVQGTLHPRGEKHPKDHWVTATVIEHCLALPDLYPAINNTGA